MNGKGDKPRNNFSKKFWDNYEQIDFGKKKKSPQFERFDFDVPEQTQLEEMENKDEN
jgi:hypothetical protein